MSAPNPKVSVLVITYNHERFIAQAIESALLQETDFNFEIVIGEDCSTDGTREIARDFQARYPDKIRLLLPDRNLGMHRNYFHTLGACRGKYVAVMEGDDFWTSPRKLQKQVDFLDRHSDYVFCFHDTVAFREDQKETSWRLCAADQKETSTIEDLLAGNFVPTCSVMFRNELMSELPDWIYPLKMLDWPLFILHAQHGYVGYLNETMAAHREHSGGTYSTLSSIEQQLSHLNMYENLPKTIVRKYEKIIKHGMFRLWYSLAATYLAEHDAENTEKYARMCFRERPFSSHLLTKLKLLLRLKTPRLFEICHKLKSRQERRAKNPEVSLNNARILHES